MSTNLYEIATNSPKHTHTHTHTHIYIYIYIHIHIHSAAVKFVNPLVLSIFLHKYDLERNQIFLKVDKDNPIKQILNNIFFVIYLLRKNDPILHI